jgi:serine phosphatase RsbU (regulator of sigma subunit)/ABC-type amino acid transport substrate-binding protein
LLGNTLPGVVLNRVKKYLFLLLLPASFPAAAQDSVAAFTAEEQAWIKAHPIVYYGYDPSWKPIEFAEDGKHMGITRGFCDVLSEKIGIKLTPYEGIESWDHAMELFHAGDVWMFPVVGDNAGRRKYLDFTSTYMTYPMVIVTSKDGAFVGSLEDLAGKTVATPTGYFETSLLEQESIPMKFLYTKDFEESLMQISMGNADATISNLAVVSHYLNYNGYENLKIAAPTGYPDMVMQMGITLKEPLLRDIIEKGLSMITQQEKNAIVQDWVSVQYDYGVNMAKVWTIAGISIAVVGSVFAFVIYWNRKLKKEINLRKEAEEKLQLLFKEVNNQKLLIEEKHKEITDSINYAERIQRSFLATKELLNENLPDYFVFFQPKEIVSGDFYWASKLSNNQFALATADSTGHGVPGAIMSLLNIMSLEKSIENNSEPAEILNSARTTIIDRLKKDGSPDGGKDGMDCSLISLDFQNLKMTYSAANNPVWIVRPSSDTGHDELLELAPDKMPVGKHDRDSISFSQHVVDLQKGDVIYTLTDGMADQFGGEKGKKFMYKKLKELLISVVRLSMPDQKEKLAEVLNNWKGDLEQVDDVTVIGIRV